MCRTLPCLRSGTTGRFGYHQTVLVLRLPVRTRQWPRAAVWAVAVAAVVAATGCGKKASPLPPVVRVPAPVTNVTAERLQDDVFVQFVLPTTNVGGDTPADLSRVEVYAFTTDAPVTGVDPVKAGQLVATIEAQPPLPPPPVVEAGAPQPPSAAPATGVPQGGTAYVRRTLTPGDRVATTLPAPRGAEALRPPLRAAVGILVPPPPRFLRRYYTAVPVGPRGRRGEPAAPVGVPLDMVAGAPSMPDVAYDETRFTITWTPPADARVELATPEGLLASRPLVEGPAPTRYQVYEVDASGAALEPRATPPPASAGTDVAAPAVPRDAAARPVPLHPAPLTQATLELPGVVFGTPRCFVVRAVDVIDGTTVEGPASPRRCLTPRDTFAPKPPRALAAVSGPGAVNLIWDANDDVDLAGYLVLRAEAGQTDLQPLTPAPIRETTYRDTRVRPGVRYVYAVVAVDRATPANTSAPSSRVEETARP